MHPQPPADCRNCGVCCFSQNDAYVRVTGADWARLDEQAERVAHFIGNRAYMKMTEGHCIALQRVSPDGPYHCSLYALRPQTCRDLERASPACHGELMTKTGSALTHLAETYAQGHSPGPV